MDMHKNARLTPLGRERMVKMVLGGQTPQAVSEAVGVCPRTVRKWVKRYERNGQCRPTAKVFASCLPTMSEVLPPAGCRAARAEVW